MESGNNPFPTGWAVVHQLLRFRQRSILEPLLFDIYTNDLPSAPQKSCFQSYVHDTKLIISFKMKDIDSLEAFADLRHDFHRISQ